MFFKVSLLLLLFPIMSCLGLECYVCKGTPGNEMSPCPDGEEIEIKECVPGFPPEWHCRIRSQDKFRTHLGCEKSTKARMRSSSSTSNVNVSPECYLGRSQVEDCFCGNNTCNTYTIESFKCLQCSAGEDDNECAEYGEIPQEWTCRMDEHFCFYRWTNDTRPRKFRGCASKFRLPEDVYTNIANISICYDKITPQGRYVEQECYCTDPLCNNYLNVRKTHSAFNKVGKRNPSSLTAVIMVALVVVVPVLNICSQYFIISVLTS